MPTVTYNGATYECTKAIKGNTYIELYDSNGELTYRFGGITNFSSFTIANGSWSEPDGVVDTRATATLSSGDLIITTDDEVGDGTMVTFKTPCDCKNVTGCLKVNDVSYDLIDSIGEIATGKSGIWGSGAMVSVLLSKTDRKAFIAASSGGASISTSILVTNGGLTVTCVSSGGEEITGSVSGPLTTFNIASYDEYTITWKDKYNTNIVVPVYAAGTYAITYSKTDYTGTLISGPAHITDITGTVLWTNPSPESPFSATEIAISTIENYKRIKVKWKTSIDPWDKSAADAPYFYTEAPCDDGVYVAFCHEPSTTASTGFTTAYRTYTPYFWSGTYFDDASANTLCIPLQIIGYKY